jgi:hypothetical protein
MIDRDPPTVPTYHLFDQPTDKAVLAARSRPWSGDHFSFHDLLDIINPLQHLPIISTIYRYVTGDDIGAVPRIVGDTLYGGPIGFITGVVGATLKQESGEDAGEHMIAMITGKPGTDVADKSSNQAGQQDAASGPAAGIAGAAVPTDAAVVAGAMPAPAATNGAASLAASPVAATAATASAGAGLPLASPRPGTSADADPRVAFLARGDAMRRLGGAQPAPTFRNRPVPLQGIALPPSFGVAKYPTAAPAPANPAAPSGPAPDLAASAGTPSLGSFPGNPPIDISQQMLDALDKYAKLQQQRGAQVDVVH